MMFDSISMKKFQDIVSDQSSINKRLLEINQEIATLPPMPYYFDQWIDELPAIDGKSFGLDTYTLIFKYRKEYSDLMEKSDRNFKEMKQLQIEALINKINALIA